MNALTPRDATARDDASECDEAVLGGGGGGSKELMSWRRAVSDATSMSQLACCLLRLQNSIAWEKSIMKVVSAGRWQSAGVTSQKLRVKVVLSKQQGLVMIKLVIVRRNRPLTCR